MPAPTTTDEFIELIQKSGVVDAGRLAAYLQPIRDRDQIPKLPNVLASFMVRDAVLTLFQAEQLLLGKWKRFTIGKYKVLERLGTGGMGQVFLCEHKLMRRRVAVKVLPTAKAEQEASLERFYREGRAVASLDHPNLVRAFDIDQEEALHFLVMEFIDGSNLHELVKRIGPLSPLRACHYIYQAAFGLQYAFECAGLVHRDIKPGNILIDRSGMIKILDMGLARFFYDEEDMLTRKYDETLGTADYLAPEQALDSHCVDIRADIYSLGATFYYLLTGSPPFADGTVAQKLMWHQTREPTPIRAKRPEVPENVVAIVERMMKKNAAERFSSPAEVAAALEPLVQTPIDPPIDAELPQLSPAARAGLNNSTTGSSRHPALRPTTAASPVAAATAVRAEKPAPERRVAAPAAVTTADAPKNRLAGAYNPYSSLPESFRSGPPSPVGDQVYATAAARAAQAPVLAAAPQAKPTKSPWWAPAVAFVVVLAVGGFVLRQIGVGRAAKPASQPGDSAVVQPE
jgi:serine/threonine protein kinase